MVVREMNNPKKKKSEQRVNVAPTVHTDTRLTNYSIHARSRRVYFLLDMLGRVTSSIFFNRWYYYTILV